MNRAGRNYTSCVFLKWAIPGLFFLYLRLFITVNNGQYKFCQSQVSNHEHLMLEATTLPSEPQATAHTSCYITLWSVLWPSHVKFKWRSLTLSHILNIEFWISPEITNWKPMLSEVQVEINFRANSYYITIKKFLTDHSLHIKIISLH